MMISVPRREDTLNENVSLEKEKLGDVNGRTHEGWSVRVGNGRLRGTRSLIRTTPAALGEVRSTDISGRSTRKRTVSRVRVRISAGSNILQPKEGISSDNVVFLSVPASN